MNDDYYENRYKRESHTGLFIQCQHKVADPTTERSDLSRDEVEKDRQQYYGRRPFRLKVVLEL